MVRVFEWNTKRCREQRLIFFDRGSNYERSSWTSSETVLDTYKASRSNAIFTYLKSHDGGKILWTFDRKKKYNT
jgi:hypothetical protein